MPDHRSVLKMESAGALTAGAGKDRFVAPFNGDIINVNAVVGTAPTGAAIVLDVLKNGVTVFTTTANRPTIAAGQTKAVATAKPDVSQFVAGDVLELQVVSVGSTVAGSDLDCVVQYTVR